MTLLMGLVLLMTWIVTPSNKLPGPKVNLPKFNSISATGIASKSENKIVVTITRKPEFLLDGKPVIEEYFHTELWKLIRQKDNPRIYLNADKALPLESAYWATTGLNEQGISELYLVVRVDDAPHERVIPVQLPHTCWRSAGDVVTGYPCQN
jgi:biopolymer transport protein ExbD